MVRTLAWSLQGSGRGKAQRSKQREAEKGTEAQRKGQRSREIAEAQRARGKQRTHQLPGQAPRTLQFCLRTDKGHQTLLTNQQGQDKGKATDKGKHTRKTNRSKDKLVSTSQQ